MPQYNLGPCDCCGGGGVFACCGSVIWPNQLDVSISEYDGECSCVSGGGTADDNNSGIYTLEYTTDCLPEGADNTITFTFHCDAQTGQFFHSMYCDGVPFWEDQPFDTQSCDPISLVVDIFMGDTDQVCCPFGYFHIEVTGSLSPMALTAPDNPAPISYDPKFRARARRLRNSKLLQPLFKKPCNCKKTDTK